MINYYDEIKEKLLKDEIYVKVKDYSKERNKVLTYFGVGKNYNRRTLFRMKQFYNLFGKQNSEQKVSPSATILTWSHITELLPLKDINEINYYINVCEKQGLSRNDLRNKILTYYEVGKLLSEAGKEYGKIIIGSYADKLVNDVGKKYNERYLRYMRQFYEMTLEIKWNPMGSVLSWSHYKVLLPLKNINEVPYLE